MRNKPTYDWDWFINHRPFKNIMEKQCGLEINTKKEKLPVISWLVTNHDVHYIKYDYNTFHNNWEHIKSLLLKTNICKKNDEVYDYVNSMTGSKRDASNIICEGCMKNATGRFSWDYGDKDNEL